MDREVMGELPAGSADAPPTDDAFLGGALNILQPAAGYRAGLDAVMLAAAVCVEREGARVLDVGAGVGTAGLCIARRVRSVQVTLLEREPALVRLAAENVRRNGLAQRVGVVAGEVGVAGATLQRLGLADASFDHVVANPPFHSRDAGTLAADGLKAGAHAMAETDLEQWARFMSRMAAPGGALTLIHKAEALAAVLAVLDGRFGALSLLPLHPHAHEPAHRIIVSGTKGSRAPLSLLPGFVLHETDGSFTPQAQAVLRAGAELRATARGLARRGPMP
jgi:tRNA1(Val) A37 N6-methylase TrmN6